jgi:hypothetical protein
MLVMHCKDNKKIMRYFFLKKYRTQSLLLHPSYACMGYQTLEKHILILCQTLESGFISCKDT